MNDNQFSEAETPEPASLVETSDAGAGAPAPIEDALLADLIEPTDTAAQLESVGSEPAPAAPDVTQIVPIGGDEPLTAYLGAAPGFALPFPEPVDVPLPTVYRDAVPVASGYTGPAFSGPASDPTPTIVAYEPAPVVPTGRPISREPRPSTIVWGFFLMAIGVGVILVASGHIFDLGLAATWLLGATGVMLLLGSILSGARRRRRAETQNWG